MFQNRRKLELLAPQERFVFRAKGGNYLDVTHLFKKPTYPTWKILRNLLLGFFVAYYITALIQGI